MLQQDNDLLPQRLSSIPITCLLGMNGFFLCGEFTRIDQHVMLINSCIERVGQSATFPADKRLVPCLTFSSVRSSINDVIIMEMSSEQTEIFYQTEKQKRCSVKAFMHKLVLTIYK